MKIEQAIFSLADGRSVLPGSDEVTNPQLVLYFGAKHYLASENFFNSLSEVYPGALLVGCTTAGEIMGNDVHDNSVVTTAIQFDSTTVRSATLQLHDAADSFSAGEKLAEELNDENLACVLIFSDGLNVNGSELVRGITSVVGYDLPVTGGLAGDGDRFEGTLVGCGTPAASHRVAAVGLYGKGLRTGHGSVGGWDAFGPRREITRSEGNVLFELDGEPALALYKKYLGEEAANLPGSALLFPLAIASPDSSDIQIVRTVLAVDDETQSMTFAGDVPEGFAAQLMRANSERLIDGAGEAARVADYAKLEGRKLAVLVSCVGRKMVLGQRAGEEIEAVSEQLGSTAMQIGYYSYGEICPHVQSGFTELHNQTMTITVLAEAS
ncbi:MAG: hypothetical protein HKN59_08945 [Gammaproteobacteria bacterium]|nr:hypothetical protein [Gammaproteobacteria bacterium]